MERVSKMKLAFIDECGNFGTDPNLKGNSSHFIITAVIIDDENYDKIREITNEIRLKHFKDGEIKSNRVFKNHAKRFEIIHSILKMDIKVISVVINKRLLNFNDSGLRFKKVYYKFLNNVLHSELKILFPNIKVIADEHGTEEFMKEFSSYVQEKGQLTMFDNFEFEFRSSKEELLIQLADFIGGTISLGYEEDKKCSEFNSFSKLLDEKILVIRHWPISAENYLVNLEMIKFGDFDRHIAELSVRAAVNYISRNRKNRETIVLDRVYVLEYLLNQIYSGNTKKYFYSDELIKHISTQSSESYSTHTFISSIIAPLRDSNVLLASSNNGYKLPMNESEIYSYANKTIGQIKPMLSRLEKARNQILAATNSNFDILDREEYSRIKKYFDI